MYVWWPATPVTRDAGYTEPSSGLHGHLHSCAHIHTAMHIVELITMIHNLTVKEEDIQSHRMAYTYTPKVNL